MKIIQNLLQQYNEGHERLLGSGYTGRKVGTYIGGITSFGASMYLIRLRPDLFRVLLAKYEITNEAPIILSAAQILTSGTMIAIGATIGYWAGKVIDCIREDPTLTLDEDDKEILREEKSTKSIDDIVEKD